MAQDPLQGLDSAHFFALSCSCRYWPEPQIGAAEDFSKEFLAESYRLPDTFPFFQANTPIEVRLGWHEEGLALEFLAQTLSKKASAKRQIDLFFDTRDLKEAQTLSRFCHHFVVTPLLQKGVGPIEVKEVTRLRPDQTRPLYGGGQHRSSWACQANEKVRLWLPAECLFGYDPIQCSHLGFNFAFQSSGTCSYFSATAALSEQQPSFWSSIKLTR